MNKIKAIFILAMLFCVISTVSLAVEVGGPKIIKATLHYEDEAQTDYYTQEIELEHFYELWEFDWKFESGDDNYYVIVSGDIELLDDYETEEYIEFPEWVTSFDGGNHTITLKKFSNSSVIVSGAVCFSPDVDLLISNVTIKVEEDKNANAPLFIGHSESVYRNGNPESFSNNRLDVVLNNVTLIGGLYCSLNTAGTMLDFSFNGCTFTTGEYEHTYIMYNGESNSGIILASSLSSSDEENQLEDACTFDISSGITYTDEEINKIFLTGDKFRYSYNSYSEHRAFVELVNELVDGVEVESGVISFLDKDDEQGICFNELEGFCDKDSYDIVATLYNFDGIDKYEWYMNESSYNQFMMSLGREFLSEEYMNVYSNSNNSSSGMEALLKEMTVEVELLDDITLFPDDILEYLMDYYNLDEIPLFFQSCNVSINGNGHTYYINNSDSEATFVIVGNGETTYKDVTFDASASEDNDYVFIFYSTTDDNQSNVTLDNVSVIGGKKAAIIIMGSNVIVNGGSYSCSGSSGLGGIEYAPCNGDVEELYYGNLTIDDEVASNNEHRLFVNSETLYMVNQGDLEAAVTKVNGYLEGTSLVLDEETGNAYEEYVPPKTFKVTYTWASSPLNGVVLTSGDTVEEGSNYKAKLPSKSGYKFTAKPASVNNVSGDITIVISYSKKSSGGSSSSPAKYKVTTVTSDNGTITPQNPKVEKGGSQTFTIIPEEGKEVADVLIDGESIGAVITYTIENVKEAHKIEVVYKEKEEIESSDWAKDEMKEADARNLIPESIRSKDLTKIINRTEFAAISVKMYEALTGTQAEIPEVNPFIDTDDEEVLKAYGLGITVGTSEITFEGELEIPREQMVTMVTRALKRAGIDTSVEFEQANKFGDDHLMHYWGREPIYFMNSKNIVVGMGNNRFGVSENSTIEQAIAVSLRSVKSFENN